MAEIRVVCCLKFLTRLRWMNSIVKAIAKNKTKSFDFWDMPFDFVQGK